MKYYLISGEASGDLHGSHLIREIRQRDPQADIRCWGGDLMQQAGAELVSHYRERAFMGFLEVARNLRTILGFMKTCKKDLLAYHPDVVVFIDYPGFNIPMATFAKQHGYKTVYYISPQVWAWKEGRVKTLKRVIDRMLVILPFEEPFYQKWNYSVTYVGHPLIEIIRKYKAANPGINPGQQTTVAILPGSRLQEIEKKLPIMLETTKQFPDCRFLIAQAPGVDQETYTKLISDYPRVALFSEGSYALLMQSHAALVTSGTATLETALFGVPEIVCYKSSWLTFAIAKRVVSIKYISLVNLILDRPAVKELIQDDLTTEKLGDELRQILFDPAYRKKMQVDMAELWDKLSPGGDASAQAAEVIVEVAGK